MIGCLLLVVAVPAALWIGISGWPPIVIRTASYAELIDSFKRATVRDKNSRNQMSMSAWDFLVQPSGSQAAVRVQGGTARVVRIKYQDESADRALYKYVDYTRPVEIRTNGNTLYVYWVETLIVTKHWILAYDILSRREVARARIDPADLKDIQVRPEQLRAT
jgi:hypothetical protein